MKVYFGLNEFKKEKNIVATIGTFDGVHKGHKKLLSRVVDQAKENGHESLLLTFYPHPRMVLFPENNDLKLLNSQEEKIALIEEIGIDHMVIHPFTREFSRLTSTEFVRDILVNKLGISHLIIGYDHHFGRNREGSIQSLSELASLYNFKLDEVQAEEINDINVSSTKIRNALNNGSVETANEYLGYHYKLLGNVVEGKQIGRSIGYPTANIDVNFKHKQVPALGVYAIEAVTTEGVFNGMLNIGYRPTVSKNGEATVEAHLFNFNANIYNTSVEIRFIKRIRNEKKFSSKNELVQQLKNDQEHCLALFANN